MQARRAPTSRLINQRPLACFILVWWCGKKVIISVLFGFMLSIGLLVLCALHFHLSNPLLFTEPDLTLSLTFTAFTIILKSA